MILSQFNQFNLEENIFKAIEKVGYKDPTPVQELVIPKVLSGLDVAVCAQTGTGKTAAFLLPILNHLSNPQFRGKFGPQILILVPTRELAMQVADEANKFSQYLSRTKTVCIYGGVPYPPQKRMLASRFEILVATPGRLMDHMERGAINLSQVKTFVLDEADRMLDMGFISAVEKIAAAMPKTRQTLLFSATLDKKILPFSKKLQNNPLEIRVEAQKNTHQHIEQRLYMVDGIDHKLRLLEHLLQTNTIDQSIVFTSTIQQTHILADYLSDRGFASEALNGDMNQRQRSRTLQKLRSGHIQFLVATDVAARGIDISTISHVFNFDLPFQTEDFVHRIGRTGRAGAKGVAITFSTFKEKDKLSKIYKFIGNTLELHTIVGMEPKANDRGQIHTRKRERFSRFNKRNSKTQHKHT